MAGGIDRGARIYKRETTPEAAPSFAEMARSGKLGRGRLRYLAEHGDPETRAAAQMALDGYRAALRGGGSDG